MGDVIAFKPRGTEPQPKPPLPPDVKAFYETLKAKETKQRVLAGLATVLGIEVVGELAVEPRIFDAKGRLCSMSCSPKTVNSRTEVCVPSSFPQSLLEEGLLAPEEALNLAADYSLALGEVTHRLKKRQSHTSQTGGIMRICGLSQESFDAQQWPNGVKPEAVLSYRAAATVALHAYELELIHFDCPDISPSGDIRPLQLAALSNPYRFDELDPIVTALK